MKHEVVTLKDIASHVGVSVATVDRALHNRGDINAETRRRILTVAEELGYQPNLVARSLVMNTRRRVGVLLPANPNYFWDELAAGVTMAAEPFAPLGVRAEVRRCSETSGMSRIVREFLDENIDALLLRPSDGGGTLEPLLHECNRRGVPIVMVNELIPSVDRLLYFGANDYEAGRTAGQLMRQLLLASGARGRIGIVRSRDLNSYSFDRRFRGFRELIEPLAPGIVIADRPDGFVGGSDERSSYDLTKYYLDNMPDLCALYNYSGSALPVARCLEDSGRQSLVLVAHEISRENAARLKSGVIDAIVSQNPFAEGYYAMKGLGDYLISGKRPETTDHYVFTDIFLRENASCGRREI